MGDYILREWLATDVQFDWKSCVIICRQLGKDKDMFGNKLPFPWLYFSTRPDERGCPPRYCWQERNVMYELRSLSDAELTICMLNQPLLIQEVATVLKERIQ